MKNGLLSEKPAVKYAAAKELRKLSEQEPRKLYGRFDEFVGLFEGENTILRWNATLILGNLAAADRENRLDAMLDRFLAPITGHEMIGAANVMIAAGRIARAKPYLADRIAARILKVEQAVYRTPECRNIAAGHAIRSLDGFFESLSEREQVLAFVRGQLKNPRAATRRKAERFLKRWAEGGETPGRQRGGRGGKRRAASSA